MIKIYMQATANYYDTRFSDISLSFYDITKTITSTIDYVSFP